MAITLAKWIADPNHTIRILATVTMRRPMDMGTAGDDWTADATYTACYRAAWPPSGHAANMKVRPTAVKHWNGTTLASYSVATSASNCNSTDGSWYYDRSAGRLYVNTTGAGTPSALPTRIWVEYPMRVGTHDFPGATGVSVQVSSEDVAFYGCIKAGGKPTFSRGIELLGAIASIGGGSLTLVDNNSQFGFADRFSREEVYDSPITIQMGGAIEGLGEMNYADYITVATGRIVGVTGSPELGEFNLQYADETGIYSSEYTTGDNFTGRPDQIISSACAAASPAVTAPTNAADLTTARDWHSFMSRQESASITQLIGAVCGASLMMHYVKRDGTRTLDYWQEPDAGETLGGTFYQGECINIRRDVTAPYTSVNVMAATGAKGARNSQTVGGGRGRSEYDAAGRFEEKMDSFTSGWTNHAVATNTAYRSWAKGGDITKVLVAGVEIPRQSSLNAIDTDNGSWGLVHDDGLTTGEPNRIYINPTGGGTPASVLNATTVKVYYMVEKSRTTQSIATGAGSKDTNIKTATSAELKAVRGRDRVYDINSIITNVTDLQSLADDALDLLKYPLDIMEFSTPLTNALQTDLNQTIKFNNTAGTASYWRVLALNDDPNSNRCTVRCWKKSDSAEL